MPSEKQAYTRKLADFASLAHNHPIGVCYVLQILDAKKLINSLVRFISISGINLVLSHGTASFFMKLRTLSQNKKTLSSIFLFENLKKCKNFYTNQIVRIKTFFAGIFIPQIWGVRLFATFEDVPQIWGDL